MATFQITAPDGRKFRVTGENAEGAFAAVQQMIGGGEQSAGPAPTPISGGQFTERFDPEAANQKDAAYENSSWLEPLSQGLTFGLSDEIVGGAMGLVSAAAGKGFSHGYDKTVDHLRSSLDAYRERHPIAAGAAEIGGAMATLPLGGINALRAPAAVAQGAPALARLANLGARGGAQVGNAALTGAAYGAAYGAGSAEGGLDQRAMAGLEGAGTGAAFGAGAGAAVPAIGAAGRAVGRAAMAPVNAVRGAVNPEAEAARRVSAAIMQDTAGQPGKAGAIADARAAGSPMMLADVGETTRALGRSAANTSPEARAALDSAVSSRFETQNVRSAEALRTIFGTQGNATLSREALEEAARKSRKPFYDRAYREGAQGVWNENLEALTQSPVMEQAMKAASSSIRNKAATGRAIDEMGPNGPPLAYWDQVKRNLDSSLSVARRQGDRELAADIAAIKDTLVRELDTAVPSYATARGVASELFKAGDALEAGEKFVSARISPAEARRAWGKMHEEERALFREGFVSKLVDDLMRVPDRRSVLNAINGSEAARQKIHMILGADGIQKLDAFVGRERIMDMTRTALQGNSTTVRQLAEMGLAGAGGFALGGGNIYDPGAWLGAVLAAGARRGVYKVDATVAKRVGELLASGDPKALNQYVNISSRSPEVRKMLGWAENVLQRASAPTAGRLPLEITVTRGTHAEEGGGR